MQIYSGCQNTFLITLYDKKLDTIQRIKKLCLKTDGLIFVKSNPLEMIIYNKDGSEASMCGNGIRCFIHYCYLNHIITKTNNKVLTKYGIIDTKILSFKPFYVYVKFNKFNDIYIDNQKYLNYQLKINHQKIKISLIEIGVWHGVIIGKNQKKLEKLLPQIKKLEKFKNINLNLCIIKKEIYIKTLEKGVGFTKSCGTGAIATYIVLKKLGIILKPLTKIYTDGGIIWVGIKQNPYLIGESKLIQK